MILQPETNQEKPAFSFLQGGGEMGERTRKYDWSQTPIGTPDQWPPSLHTSVSILLNSRFPMFVWWGKELTTIYNDSYRIIAGNKHPTLLGQSGREGWAEIWHDLSPLVEKVFNGGSTWSEDLLLTIERHGFIEEAYFTFSYSPILDESGAVGGLFCAVVETTEKVVGKKKLEESESLFRNMVQQAPVAFTLTRGPENVIEIINAPMLQIMNKKTEEEALGMKLIEALPELTDQPILQVVQNVFETGIVFRGAEVPVSLVANQVLEQHYFDISYTPLIEEGIVTGVLHVAIDVTEQVVVRKRVEESEQNLRNTILQSPVASCILKGPNHVVEVANERIIELWGAMGRDVLGKSIFDAVPEVRGQGFEALLDHVYSTGEPYKAYGVPLSVLRKDSLQTVYVDFVYEAYKEDQGNISGVIAVAIEVTEQVIARQKIELAEEKVRLAVASAGLGTYEINLDTDEIITSDRFNQIWGLDHTISRADFVAALHPDDQQARLQATQQAAQNGALMYEARVIRKDGSQRWVRINGKIMYDKKGQASMLTGVAQDITEQKLFAEELSKQVSQRTAELENINNELKRSNQNLEEFAYAASHDMKEPIRKIHFFTDRLKSILGKSLNEEQARYFERMEAAAKRMSTLIDDLLLYSHISRGAIMEERADLNEILLLVQEDLELETEEKKATITISPLPTIKGHKRQLQQLFQNLIGNSLKYSKPGVPPEIHITYASGTDATPQAKGEGEQKQYHLIKVRDNGIGFEQEDAERIFNVFTRLHGNAEYRGTGVGLSIVRKVVENHHGRIEAESTPGKGSTFNVYLPAS